MYISFSCLHVFQLLKKILNMSLIPLLNIHPYKYLLNSYYVPHTEPQDTMADEYVIIVDILTCIVTGEISHQAD